MKELVELFLTFATVGVTTFGGGIAMLPILERELIDKRKWVTEDELLDYYAIGQCTPGIIAVNTATFVGCKRKGTWGGIFATLGVIFPSVVIIILIATLLTNFSHIAWVQHAFSGIRAAVCALIISTLYDLIKKRVKNIFEISVFVFSFIISGLLNINPIFVVIGAIIAGISYNLIKEKKNGTY